MQIGSVLLVLIGGMPSQTIRNQRISYCQIAEKIFQFVRLQLPVLDLMALLGWLWLKPHSNPFESYSWYRYATSQPFLSLLDLHKCLSIKQFSIRRGNFFCCLDAFFPTKICRFWSSTLQKIRGGDDFWFLRHRFQISRIRCGHGVRPLAWNQQQVCHPWK